MVILTFVIVILRYLFNIGFIWMQELVRYLYAAVFMLCAAYTLAKDEHVRVDIFYSKLKDRHKIIINVIGSLLFLIPVCLVFILFIYLRNKFLGTIRRFSRRKRASCSLFIKNSNLGLCNYACIAKCLYNITRFFKVV